ncbi:hypothetical protein GPECTOR_3g413 [Gonium pectorale]|uniref:Uncharacterized protein n=1 Tax=Gonium pectorale TaxID=33097 RepID=A0A150GZD4_GONPE|nr:hypothetical protein GPECTOR_3g413 [Gonium pectorale]|eukprot:KXZ55276.1 hypothetical protein GPECTOR_3g413 [Gonium pectorale]
MFDEMEAFTNLLSPGAASVVTAVIAATSVSINLYGGLLTERKRAEIAKQVERERQAAMQMKEMRSLVARYRGPLLEAAVDLESRLVAVATGRSTRGGGRGVVEEEVLYTLFTIAQFLGFVELVRREGPRERSFLQQGNPQGTDTLANLLEGFRFILCAHPSALQAWYDEGDARGHPGARSRPGTPYRELALSLQARAAGAAAGTAATAVADSNGSASVSGAGNGSWSGNGASASNGNGVAAPGNGRWEYGSRPVQNAANNYDAVSTGGVSSSGTAYSSNGNGHGNGNGLSGGAASGLERDGWPMAQYPGPGAASTSSSRESGGGGGGASGGKPRGDWAGGNVLHMSRGTQRAVGSFMIITPMGAPRHYTLSYSDFYRRFYSDPSFAAWLQPIFEDLVRLTAIPGGWPGVGPFPVNGWTRLLLLQQLLVDTIDLLDPFMVRTSAEHRLRLAPIAYAPLPSAESYKERLRVLESMADTVVPSMNSAYLRVGWARNARDGHPNEYLGPNAHSGDKLSYLSGGASPPGAGSGGGAGRPDGKDGGSVAVRAAYERGAAGMSFGSLDESDTGVGIPYYVGDGPAVTAGTGGASAVGLGGVAGGAAAVSPGGLRPPMSGSGAGSGPRYSLLDRGGGADGGGGGAGAGIPPPHW